MNDVFAGTMAQFTHYKKLLYCMKMCYTDTQNLSLNMKSLGIKDTCGAVEEISMISIS